MILLVMITIGQVLGSKIGSITNLSRHGKMEFLKYFVSAQASILMEALKVKVAPVLT